MVILVIILILSFAILKCLVATGIARGNKERKCTV